MRIATEPRRFYDHDLPCGPVTAPVTEWMSRQTGVHLSDVLMPDSHIIRAVAPDMALGYLGRGGIVLPRGFAQAMR